MFPKLMAKSRLQDESRDDVPIHRIVLTRPPDTLGGRVNNRACVRPALLFKSGSVALLSPADGLRKAVVRRSTTACCAALSERQLSSNRPVA
jgi:hypothetical protein